jgi:hypothetical protein
MALWHGQVGNCLWFYFSGKLTQETWREYIAVMREGIGREDAIVALTVAYRSESPSASMRKELAVFMNSHANAISALEASAFVTESALARGAMTAMQWISRRPFHEKTHGSIDAALAWLAGMAPGLDPGAVVDDMRRNIPGESYWAES